MAADKKTTESTDRPKSLLDELERSGEAISREVLEHLQTVQDKVLDVAEAVSETALAVTDKVASEDTRKRLLKLADDLEDGGKYVVRQLTEIVGALQERVTDTLEGLTSAMPGEPPAEKTRNHTARKRTTKKAGKKASKKKTVKKAARKTGVARAAAKKTRKQKTTTGKR